MEDSHSPDDRKRPIAILLLGLGGTGKSATATELQSLTESRGYEVELIRFDELRKSLAPMGADAFSSDRCVKRIIYERASSDFIARMRRGRSLIIDSGLSVESIRRRLKRVIPSLRIVHIYCPLLVAIFRDTVRSLRGEPHERGPYLYLRGLLSLLNPFQTVFPQPGITARFERPDCADCHINTFMKSPRMAAEEVLRILHI